MKQALMAAGSPLNWSMMGLLLFCMIFTGIVIWTFRRGSKEKYDKMAQLALDTENSDER
jgi:cbb3-type cytochrome oxidase subunit 3